MENNSSSTLIQEIIIGISDGIALPFVITAGLSAVQPTSAPIVSIGVLVATVNAITMGIGAYDTNRMEARHFNTDSKTKEIKERKFLSNLDLSEDIQDLASLEIHKEESKWNEFLQQKPSPAFSTKKGIYKAFTCMIGGIIPLIPFMLMNESLSALKVSFIITLTSLLIVGYIKGKAIGGNGYSEAIRTTLYTMLAAACIYVVAGIIHN